MERLLICLCVAVCLCACKETKPDTDSASTQKAEQNVMSDGGEYEKNGRYCIFRTPVSMDSEDGRFHVDITMEPDFSLPAVNNESFNRIYCDNRASLCVTSASDTVVSRQLDKMSFAEYIDSNIASRAIFNRLSCRGFEKDAVKLEAEISVPHSDEECYVTIIVNRDGTVEMKRYEVEEVPEEIAGA